MTKSENTRSNQFKPSTMSRWRIDPKRVAQRFLQSFDDWRDGRSWSVAAIGLVPFFVLAFVFCIVLWGKTIASASLPKNYLKEAEEAAPVKEDGTGANEGAEEIDKKSNNTLGASDNEEAKAKEREELAEYAFRLYRRVLERESNNKRAMYYVAYQMAERNDLANARLMMNKLAPDDSEGYPAAHAWKAFDLMQSSRAKQAQPDRKLLEHHLAIASKWGGTPAQLLAQRARLLEGEGKTNQALAMYSIAADRDPNFKLMLADAFKRQNQPSRMQQTIDSAVNYFSRNLNLESEEIEDRLKVAQAHLISNDVQKAIAILEEGLAKSEKKDEYRRAISQVLRLAYLGTAKFDNQTFAANLVLLDRAFEVDPANPELQAELNRLTILLGQPNSIQASIDSLTNQLAAASAPTLSHLLLANLHYLQNSLPNAQLHWDLALKLNPNIVVALRSYALSLATQPEPDFEKALALIDRAVEQSNGSAEALDAKGDILVRMEKSSEAVAAYEAALQKAPPIVSAPLRKKLVVLYGELGDEDKANREMKVVELIEARIKEMQANQALATEAPAEPANNATPPLNSSETTPETTNDESNAVDEDLQSLIKELEVGAEPNP